MGRKEWRGERKGERERGERGGGGGERGGGGGRKGEEQGEERGGAGEKRGGAGEERGEGERRRGSQTSFYTWRATQPCEQAIHISPVGIFLFFLWNLMPNAQTHE